MQDPEPQFEYDDLGRYVDSEGRSVASPQGDQPEWLDSVHDYVYEGDDE